MYISGTQVHDEIVQVMQRARCELRSTSQISVDVLDQLFELEIKRAPPPRPILRLNGQAYKQYAHMHMHMHTHTHTHTHMHMCTHMHMEMHTHTHMHIKQVGRPC